MGGLIFAAMVLYTPFFVRSQTSDIYGAVIVHHHCGTPVGTSTILVEPTNYAENASYVVAPSSPGIPSYSFASPTSTASTVSPLSSNGVSTTAGAPNPTGTPISQACLQYTDQNITIPDGSIWHVECKAIYQGVIITPPYLRKRRYPVDTGPDDCLKQCQDYGPGCVGFTYTGDECWMYSKLYGSLRTFADNLSARRAEFEPEDYPPIHPSGHNPTGGGMMVAAAMRTGYPMWSNSSSVFGTGTGTGVPGPFTVGPAPFWSNYTSSHTTVSSLLETSSMTLSPSSTPTTTSSFLETSSMMLSPSSLHTTTSSFLETSSMMLSPSSLHTTASNFLETSSMTLSPSPFA
ncbi:hypothetical protein LTR37_014635 [Vermiconidia calcicola]|uniref:Uncharacterized protein n=1 Tax=Vermiconidia calcicola TaxID=1690605 RepID=A0ACC3MUJ2_9PEZI|nr:hypothetical protein LTR37_014635 [Vermiconidia calcicola]